MKVAALAVVAVMAAVGLGAAAPQASGHLAAIAKNLLQERDQRLKESNHWGLNLTTPEIIDAVGYPVEIHHVTTEDGYILELHRIPYGAAGPSDGRPVAFLQHCILCSSSDYIMNTPDQALAYVLADAGYDVWLNNIRGNTYSRNHVELDPEKLEFWKFSLDEMAYYDVPASIDFVLEATGAEAVYYVGWSMGTTLFFTMMSERPEYNLKVKAMAAMAPVAYLEHAKSPLVELAPYMGELDLALTLIGQGELFPSDALMDYIATDICDVNSTMVDICHEFLFLIAGPDSDGLNEELVPLIVSHMPAGTSVHSVNHYAQWFLNGKFQKYDFGYFGNLGHYGQAEPPLYSLANVTAPVALFWGNTDWLIDPVDVERVAAELPNVALNHNVNKTEFNHLDFGWCKEPYEYVYRHILDFFTEY